MLVIVIAVLSIHVVSTVFWAGVTIVQARTGAAGVQGAMGGPAVRQLKIDPSDGPARARLAAAQRIASLLLAIALICMVTAKYA